MAVLVIVGQNRNIRKSGIIQRLAQQRAVVRQSAVTDIFSHADGNLFVLVFSAHQRFQRLTNDNLRRKANIIVHILLAELDGSFSADRQRFRLDVLRTERRRHHAAECV